MTARSVSRFKNDLRKVVVVEGLVDSVCFTGVWIVDMEIEIT